MEKPRARLLRALGLYGTAKRVQHYLRQPARRMRARQETRIPKVALSDAHVAHCTVVVNRAALLDRLPKHAAVAEIGVDRGGFSAQILETARPRILHMVDVWASARYHDGLFHHVTSTFEEEIAAGRVVVHRALSTDAADQFEDAYFDWIYIDTDHSYATTRDELALYAGKVKPGGIIAGHDYVVGNWVDGYRYGVVEAVHEFCVSHDWELLYLTADPLELQSFAIRRMGTAVE